MSETIIPQDTTTDRVKLPFFFDVDKVLKEIKAVELSGFIYYDVLPLRAPAHVIDPSQPFPPPAEDFADGSWTPWLNNSLLENAPYLKSIIETFQEYTKVNLVRLLRLAPGAVVKEHTDPTLGLEVEKSVIRLTVPILNNDAVEFYLNDNLVPMKPGECWYLRLTDPHRVINGGTEERINLTIDMIPNDKIRSMIMDNQEQ